MLTQIQFANYKCLPETPFLLDKINVFTGFNGRGKSSLLQALLMLSQSIVLSATRDIRELHLNGSFVELGDFDEIQSDDRVDKVSFTLKMDNDGPHEVVLGYGLSDKDIKVAKLIQCEIDGTDYFSSVGFENPEGGDEKGLNQLPEYINKELSPAKIHFISASRQGPVKYVEKREIPLNHKVGVNGDLTINTLSTYKDLVSPEMNVNPDDTRSYDLREAAQQWISYIMDGGKVNVEDTSRVNAEHPKEKSSVLSMDFIFEGKGNGRKFKAYHVGFGYSYIMSIVVTALIAKPGNVVIIENPEAHLHPLAQLHLTYMLARLAARQVQVYVETHSDHILNGLRLAALKDEYAITTDDLRIYFFDNDFSVKSLKVEPNGKIRNWPSGFFDQINSELGEILKLGSKK